MQPLDVTVRTRLPAAPAARSAAAAAAGTPEPGAPRAAVVVCHGMGQQVPFQTLDAVVRTVAARAAAAAGGQPSYRAVVELVPAGELLLPRAELTLDGRVVHFYEAYWAPLTEGKVTLRNAIAFLLDAALRGLRFALADGMFDRRMFGARQEFEIPARVVLQLALTLWVLLCIVAAMAGFAALVAATALAALRAPWPHPAELASLSGSVIGALAGAAAAALVGALASAALFRARVAEAPATRRRTATADARVAGVASPPLQRAVALLVAASVAIASAVGAFVLRRWLLDVWLMPLAVGPRRALVPLLGAGLLVALVGICLFFLRYFLIQYAGDVAAYISAYRVSKFQEIRTQIQSVARRVVHAVYSAVKADRPDEPLYDAVYVVGHSLGSVVAYDALNDALNRDALGAAWGAQGSAPSAAATNGATGASGATRRKLGVAERTKLLLTFGSPLDKTALVFRTQQTSDDVDVREGLATAVQPLIQDYAYRPAHWINLWSRSDWISGSVDYYDAPPDDSPANRAEKGVLNVRETAWRLPWVAHNEYWTRPLLGDVLFAALTGECASTLPEQVRRALCGAATSSSPRDTTTSVQELTRGSKR